MKDQNCGYCMRGELLDTFGIYICDLSVGTLLRFKEKSHSERCIVAYKDHVSERVDVSEEDRNAFSRRGPGGKGTEGVGVNPKRFCVRICGGAYRDAKIRDRQSMTCRRILSIVSPTKWVTIGEEEQRNE